jgi:hypothetical protein
MKKQTKKKKKKRSKKIQSKSRPRQYINQILDQLGKKKGTGPFKRFLKENVKRGGKKRAL